MIMIDDDDNNDDNFDVALMFAWIFMLNKQSSCW